jgi:hypothetical protein
MFFRSSRSGGPVRYLTLAILVQLVQSARGDAAGADEASQRFREGVDAAEAGQDAQAAAAFEAAYRSSPHPRVLFNLGTTYLRLERTRDAVAAFELYLKTAGAEVPAPRRETLEAILARETQRLARVVVDAWPADCRVQMDGADMSGGLLGPSPWVLPGTHSFEFSKEGFVTERRVLSVAAGESLRISIQLQELPAAPPERPVAVGASTGATPTSPETNKPLPSLATQAGPERDSPRPLPLILAGTGAALLVTAGILYGWNSGRFDDWSAEDRTLRTDSSVQANPTQWEQRRQQNNDRLTSIRRVDTAALVLSVGGVAAEVTALILWGRGRRPNAGIGLAGDLSHELALSLWRTW